MKRKAILIESSNVSGQSYLPGAAVDIKNWKNFLLSDLGGAWIEGEILQLNKPAASVVANLLNNHSDHYCFVAFSGHGCDGHVTLNDGEQMCPLSFLTPRGPKGALLVDSCRGLFESEIYSFSTRTAVAANEFNVGRRVVLNAKRGVETKFGSATPLTLESVYYSGLITSGHRNLWHSSLSGSPQGVVKMLACSVGQAAGEDPNSGGYYTSLLLQSADLWQTNSSRNSVHTTKQAHDHAVNKLIQQQKPEYSPSNVAFPFAVKA